MLRNSVSYSASPELVEPVLDEHTLYYTENLNTSCECKGIPAPDVNWATSSTTFSKQITCLPNSGECSGVYHSDQYIVWSIDADDHSRKDANGMELKCECSHDGDDLVDRVTVLDIQCKHVNDSKMFGRKTAFRLNVVNAFSLLVCAPPAHAHWRDRRTLPHCYC